jgi:acyl carrier protein
MEIEEAKNIIERSIFIVTGSKIPAECWVNADRGLLRDLGVTSLMLYQLTVTVEDIGGLSLADEDVRADNFVSLGSATNMLLSYERDESVGGRSTS